MKCRSAVFISLCGGESLVITRNGGGWQTCGASRTPPPYNYGAWGLLPDYTPISAHSDNKDNYTNALGHDYKEVTTKNAPVHERT